MKKISIPIDPVDVLNNFTIEEMIQHFGISDICSEISVGQYMDLADIDKVLNEIHERNNETIREFAEGVYCE